MLAKAGPLPTNRESASSAKATTARTRKRRPPPKSKVLADFDPTVKHPAATVYPDSDKIAVWTGNREDDLIVHRSSSVDYWSGEPTH